MLCSFFNISLEIIMKVANINTRNVIYTKSSQILGYSDDLDVIGKTIRDADKYLFPLQKVACDVGLKVNEEKTKYQLSNRKEARHRRLIRIMDHSRK